MSRLFLFFLTFFFTLSSLFSQENNANSHAPLAKGTSVILDQTLEHPDASVEELFSPVFFGQEKEFVLSTPVMSSLSARSDHQQANEWAFAGILEDGSIYAWGDESKGGISPHLPKKQDGTLKRAKSIFSNVWAFVAVLEDGSLWEWGCREVWANPIDRAVSLPAGKKATCCLASTASAFAAILDDGSLFAWGTNPSARKAPVVPKDEQGKPKKACCLYSNKETFTAVFPDKTLLAWGNLNGGGDSDHKTVALPAGKKLLSCCAIAAAQSAFAAILEDHTLFVWGKSAGEFSPPKIPVGKIPLKIAAGDNNFTLLLEDEKHDQSFLSWGKNFSRGEEKALPAGKKVKANCCIAANYLAFATILEDGAIFTWGEKFTGGDFQNQPHNRSGHLIEAECIVANDQAFAASLKDGSILSWGNYYYGGTFWYNHGNIFPGEQEKDFYASFTKVNCCLVANHAAFSAFLDDGSALAWGSYLYGGNLYQEDAWVWGSTTHGVEVNLLARSINPSHQANITSLVSNGSAFAAFTDQGSLLKWGLSSYGGGYDEELLAKDLPGGQKLKTIATPLKKEIYYLEDQLAGVALIENKTSPDQGEWQYFSNSTSEWKAIPHDLTEMHAFCLSTGTKLRFVPAPNGVGASALLEARLLSVRAPCFQTGSMGSSMPNMVMETGCCFVNLTEKPYLDTCSIESVGLTTNNSK